MTLRYCFIDKSFNLIKDNLSFADYQVMTAVCHNYDSLDEDVILGR